MKKLVTSLLGVMVMGQAAQADIFVAYEALGQSVYQKIDADYGQEQLQAEIYDLADLGYQIMDLYAKKYSDCADQYAQVRSEDEMMRNMTYEELDLRYHDGVGLPSTDQAPRNCYLGRSMVAHPYMALALYADGLTSSEKKSALHEIEEVVERADRLKQILEN